jgi:alanine-glyoxylate transaminase/serine-glyoxylate transaminase/serine-pyruvate transaminase
MTYRSGRHFLQLPGPTNTPFRLLQAMARPVIDHRGPEFARMTEGLLEDLGWLFHTAHPVFIYPSSATGAWEAALANTLSPGDRVLAFDHGVFAGKWCRVAERLGLHVQRVSGDWRRPPDPSDVEALLMEDKERAIRAVLFVHSETSTGVRTDVGAMREALDRAGHPALLLVDAVSSLGCMEFLHDEWRVDVTVCGSQKGMMLPGGLGFTAVSPRALEASKTASIPSAYWRWDEMLQFNERGFFPYTSATSLLYGLQEALAMLREEGLGTVYARHERHARATRRAVEAWGLEMVPEAASHASSSLTAVFMPEGHDADRFREVVLERFDMSLGKGLDDLEGRVFRIGHLGDFNDLMLAGTLAGVEMGLSVAGVPHRKGGAQAALEYLACEDPANAGAAS